jgi:hypothetical protein
MFYGEILFEMWLILKDAMSEFMGNILKGRFAPQSIIISQIVCRFPVTDAVQTISLNAFKLQL